MTALLAAAMLIYVGFWLHSKAYAHAWSRFIKEQVGAALEKKTLWAMAGVSFLAVYRELFEIVLFYQALWAQAGADGRHALLGGIAAAAVLLAAIGWAIFKYSVRLPIGPFFAVMSVLLALMAVVFAGNGAAALQEAGVLGADPVEFVSVPALGVHPTLQTLTARRSACWRSSSSAFTWRVVPNDRQGQKRDFAAVRAGYSVCIEQASRRPHYPPAMAATRSEVCRMIQGNQLSSRLGLLQALAVAAVPFGRRPAAGRRCPGHLHPAGEIHRRRRQRPRHHRRAARRPPRAD